MSSEDLSRALHSNFTKEKIMNTFKKVLGTAAIALSASMPVKADIVLDNFTYFTDAALTSPLGETSLVTGDATLNVFSIIGAATSYTFNATGSSINPNVITGDGILSYSAGANNDVSDLTVTYASTPLDFTAFGDAFYVVVDELNVGTDDGDGVDDGFDPVLGDGDSEGFSVNVTVEDSAGNTATISALEFNNQILSQTLMFSFASFTLSDPSFSFASLVSASVNYVNEGDGADFIISEIGVVPEPAALGVLGLGLVGLGFRRRKNAK
jgi:hypothetical protein